MNCVIFFSWEIIVLNFTGYEFYHFVENSVLCGSLKKAVFSLKLQKVKMQLSEITA